MDEILISIFGACLLVFPFFIVSLVQARSPKRCENALNQAIAKGHVVTAVLKRKHSAVPDPFSRSGNGMVDMGVYEYVYKGRKYKYKRYDSCLPSTVRLYFVKKPRKATEASAVGTTETVNWLPIVFILACLIYLIGNAGV